jgi:hypothetical protein
VALAAVVQHQHQCQHLRQLLLLQLPQLLSCHLRHSQRLLLSQLPGRSQLLLLSQQLLAQNLHLVLLASSPRSS